MTGWLADAVLVLHLAFILFVMTGGLLVFRWPRAAWLHLPAALWGLAVEWTGWICPLTPLENALRRGAGEAGYAGGFVERYLVPLIYPDWLTRDTQLVLGGAVLAVNLIVYGACAVRHARRRRRAALARPVGAARARKR